MSERIHTDIEREEAPPEEELGTETPADGDSPGQAPGDAPAPVPEQLEERLAAAEATAEQRLDDLRRLAAEFDNYRKRTARDQASVVARANERLVKELLPVLDDLGRALEAAEKHEEAALEEGVALVHRSLAAALEREGLAEIETDGRFDPHVHEALLSQPSEAEEGTVIQVVQKGYRLGDRVLRPARVVVAEPLAEPPVRESGPGEGDRGNREVPPADNHSADNHSAE